MSNDWSLLTHWTPSDFWLYLRMNHDPFITSRWPDEKTLLRTVNCYSFCCQRNLCLATCYIATTRSLLFVAAGTWFTSRCSALYIPSGDFQAVLIEPLPKSGLFRHSMLFRRNPVFKWLNVGQRHSAVLFVCCGYRPAIVERKSNRGKAFYDSEYVYHMFCFSVTCDVSLFVICMVTPSATQAKLM
jgi:hypothetical protein